jgi:hypothetical protein
MLPDLMREYGPKIGQRLLDGVPIEKTTEAGRIDSVGRKGRVIFLYSTAISTPVR